MSRESGKEISPEDYHRAVVEAFLYYLSSHSILHADLLTKGIKEGLKEWLDGQTGPAAPEDLGLKSGAVTEFHEALETVYTLIDQYGRASREWGKNRARLGPGDYSSTDGSEQAYEAEKHLKREVEKVVNENIRLKRQLESQPAAPGLTGGEQMRQMLREAFREWLRENKDEVLH